MKCDLKNVLFWDLMVVLFIHVSCGLNPVFGLEVAGWFKTRETCSPSINLWGRLISAPTPTGTFGKPEYLFPNLSAWPLTFRVSPQLKSFMSQIWVPGGFPLSYITALRSQTCQNQIRLSSRCTALTARSLFNLQRFPGNPNLWPWRWVWNDIPNTFGINGQDSSSILKANCVGFCLII